MFGHRSFLLLGDIGSADIISLIKGGYEIASCQFSFHQGIDNKGKATTRVLGGSMQITLSQLPPQPIIDWALRPKKYVDGMIVMVDAENVPLEKVIFKEGACIDMKLEYAQTGDTYMSTKLLIQTAQLTVGDGIEFQNEWIK